MFRVVLIALAVLVVWTAGVSLVRGLRGRSVDWTGVATMVGFVVMAFWLRHVTGMG